MVYPPGGSETSGTKLGRRSGSGLPGSEQRRPGNWYRGPAIPELPQHTAALVLQLLESLHGRVGLRGTAGQLRVLRAPQPFPLALDRLHHEQVRHGLVVREVVGRIRLACGRAHQTKGTQAMGTPASDWRAFSVAVIQLSPSASRAEAGRIPQRLRSAEVPGQTPPSRSAPAPPLSRRPAQDTHAAPG